MNVLLNFAKFYGTMKHTFFYKKGGPQLYSGLPYTHHLQAVAAVANRFKDDIQKVKYGALTRMFEDIECACWLHDTIEDTHTKLRDIVENFGEPIANLVGAVTNDDGGNPEATRKVKAALTYPKIRRQPGAVALKLCDRIANVEHGGSVKMYAKEHEDFKRALYTPGEYEVMWKHLDWLIEHGDEVL